MGEKTKFVLFFIMILFSSILSANEDFLLWYDQPADHWLKALPVGNGRLGAMVFGGAEKERIQLNEDTIWAKGAIPGPVTNAMANILKARAAYFRGEYVECEKIIQESVMNERIVPRNYQLLGNLYLNCDLEGAVKNYKRLLDMNTAIVRTEFYINGISYIRKVFVSPVDQVIIVRLESG